MPGLWSVRGDVEFRGVHFAYDKDNTLLNGMTFHVPPGMRVGIAGKTGAGKTTLVSLLTRFYDCHSGSILLDGVDIRSYKLADLRNQFAIVLQDPLLFSTSIAENISYARPGAGMKEIVEAAKAANAHEFITHLPEGYETLVGERGMRLSGGERQRIALARAFLKDAPILILDEPTSSVDAGTEAGIMESMERLMEGRSTFLVSHRMDILKNCNILLVIEEGRLIALSSDVAKTIQEGILFARLVGRARPGREDRGMKGKIILKEIVKITAATLVIFVAFESSCVWSISSGTPWWITWFALQRGAGFRSRPPGWTDSESWNG
jgi:ABC-type multidrug transport system fused ATPase/permease subunit